ncbi:MAG: hypothetical protein QXR60_02690 [Candidatus Nanoarchaeia archaeon]
MKPVKEPEEFEGVGELFFLCPVHSNKCPFCSKTVRPYTYQCKSCGADFKWDKGHCLVCAYLKLGF